MRLKEHTIEAIPLSHPYSVSIAYSQCQQGSTRESAMQCGSEEIAVGSCAFDHGGQGRHGVCISDVEELRRKYHYLFSHCWCCSSRYVYSIFEPQTLASLLV